RISYYDSLSMVRKNNDLEQWIKFFLNGVIDTANDSINTFRDIIGLRLKYEEKILSLGVRAKSAQKLVNYMFSRPIVSSKSVQKNIEISLNTSNRLLKALIDLQILKEVTGYSRNRLYVLQDYLNLFKK
ncbi:MAG TPA: Fic family protein, partial [bacterium]|nr:Fic family protein [bacterium]